VFYAKPQNINFHKKKIKNITPVSENHCPEASEK
jgi:hypothetical protein